MAKQSGIHQIKGKVGEMSYYKTKGVSGGLIRSINQGLSARVKNGEEYANTRRSNAEFGQACRIAGVLGYTVVPKWRPMFLTFSQSAIAKKVLELIKMDTTPGIYWGRRGLTESRFDSALQALNDRAKNPFSQIVANMSLTAGSTDVPARAAVDVDLEFSPDLESYMQGIACEGVHFYAQITDILVGNFTANIGQYENTSHQPLGAGFGSYPRDDQEATLVTLYRPSQGSAEAPSFSKIVVAVVAVPYRVVNGEEYEMQEFATFRAMTYTPA